MEIEADLTPFARTVASVRGGADRGHAAAALLDQLTEA
jgi:hypothetical protein